MRHTRKIAVGAAALAVVGGGVFYAGRFGSPGSPTGPTIPGAINPVVTQANIGDTVCKRGWTSTVRPPASYTDPIKHELELRDGHGDTNGAHWELDHRVPLGSGGAPVSRQNLWLQAIGDAKVKDKLEIRVQRDICNGSLTLAQAQAVWLGNWYKARVP